MDKLASRSTEVVGSSEGDTVPCSGDYLQILVLSQHSSLDPFAADSIAGWVCAVEVIEPRVRRQRLGAFAQEPVGRQLIDHRKPLP